MATDPKPAKPRTPRRSPNLERDKVVVVALELLNDVGFEGMTLRRLADRLGVKAAALYWHFTNKQDLINQMAGKLIADEIAEYKLTTPDPSWREVLTFRAYGTRRALTRARDGALVVASAELVQTAAYSVRNEQMAALFDHGFSADLVLSSIFTVERYALGCVLEEQAGPHMRGSSPTDIKLPPMATTHEYPAITRAFKEMSSQEYLRAESRFEQGLQIILDGIAVRFEAST